jgi:hypothetical protein
LAFDLKTHKGNQFFKMYSVQSLMSVKEKVLKILSGLYIHMSSLTLDLKINSGHLLFTIYYSTKFEVCQAKGSQNIELLVYSYVQFDPLTFEPQIL